MPFIIPIIALTLAVSATTLAVATLVVTGILLGVTILLSHVLRSHAATITSQMTVRQPVSYRRIIYGNVRAAGVMTYCGLSGSKNEYLHMVLTLAGHQVQSIGSMYFDGTLASPSSSSLTYYYDLETDLGNPATTSQPFPHLASAISDWSSNCLQRGCAKAHVTLKYDTTKYPSGAPSSIAFDIQGKLIYDPRTSATAYSDNPALCIRDYLTDTKYGLGADSASIDDAYTDAAANTCEESVTINATNTATIGSCTYVRIISGQAVVNATNNLKVGAQVALSGFSSATFLNGLTVTVLARTATTFTFAIAYTDYAWTDSGTATAPSTQPRYTCDGVFDAGQVRGDVLNSLCSSMAGYIVAPGDAWRIYAGAYRTPTIILTQDDLRGPIKMDTLCSKRDLANGITGTFVSPSNNWQQSSFPPFLNATYVTQDGGQKIWKDLPLPFTTNGVRAQRLAKITLEHIRRQKTLTLPCKLSAFPLQPGDTCMFTFAPFGFNEKIFEVQQASVVADASNQLPYNESADSSPISQAGHAPVIGVDLVLREIDSGVFSWNYATDENTWLSPSTTTVPNLKVCQPPTGVSVTSGSGTAMVRADGIIQDRLLVSWTQPADQYVVKGGSIEIYTSVHAAGTFSLAGTVDGDDSQFYILNVVDGTAYDVIIYAVNAAGVTSAGVEVDNTTASGGTTNFGGNVSSIPAADVAASLTIAAWAGSTAYTIGMNVTHSGNTYKCSTANSDASWTVGHWTLIGPTNLDAVGDGSTYAKSLSSALTSGVPSTISDTVGTVPVSTIVVSTSQLLQGATFLNSNNAVLATANVGGTTSAASWATVGSWAVNFQANINTYLVPITLLQSAVGNPVYGPTIVGTGANVSNGGSQGAWTNYADITAEDGAGATSHSIPTGGGYTDWLQGTMGADAFAIPTDATINGIKVELKVRATTAGLMYTNGIQLVKAGAAAGTVKNSGAFYAATLTYETWGSSTDMWGTTWTPAQINASNFGAQFWSEYDGGSGTKYAYCDDIRITIYTTGGTFTAQARVRIGANDGTTVSLSGAGPTSGTSTITSPASGAQTVTVEAKVTSDCGGTVQALASQISATPQAGSQFT